MSRDYSNYGKTKKRSGSSRGQTTRRKPARKKNNSGGMFWFVSGLAVGSLATAMILVPDIRPEIPAISGDSNNTNSTENYEPDFEFHTLLSDDTVVLAPDREPVVDSSASPQKPQPRSQSATSATTSEKQEMAGNRTPATSTGGDVFLLQAGSFKSASDADERRVQLLLMNLTASIEKAKTSGGDTRYRVIVGPFSDRNAVNAALKRVSANGIETLLLKRKKQ